MTRDPLHIAELIDAYRIVPRALTVGYALMAWQVTSWFMGLPDPTGPQGALVSTVWGAAAAWFGLYTNTGRRWGAK